MKPGMAARDPNSAGSRRLPVDAVTGEIYTFDAGDPIDRDNLAWLIGGDPANIYKLGAILIEVATQQGIEAIPPHTAIYRPPFEQAS